HALKRVGVEGIKENFPFTINFTEDKNFTVQVNNGFLLFKVRYNRTHMVVSADNRGISVDPDRVKRKIGLKLFTLEQIIVLPLAFFCIVSRQL
ncbi:hypothetical protein, partial [Escherichia coli]|uniref:hypothetical protein n=1 Tax=Escherichia coli TaxID=562 RepID=UPI001BEBDF4E